MTVRRSKTTFLFLFFIGIFTVQAWAESSTDQYIKDLKSADPEVRANAAFELGCS
ncbi:MAG: hypothetical protein ACP5LD_03455 [Desulfomonilaceae bacterium]